MTKQGNTETDLTRYDVERAWRDQAKAVDRWEWLVMHSQPEDVCEQAWEDMQDATHHAEEMDRIFADQYRRRGWLSNGERNLPEVVKISHETECKRFAWMVRHGYIQRSEINGSWCIRAISTDGELLLAVYNCPYCGKALDETEQADEQETERQQ